MKKIVGLIAAVSIFAGITAVISCSLTQSEVEDDGIKAPTVKLTASNDSYQISSSAIKNSVLKANISYANIIRESCEDEKFSSDKIVRMNIGQVNRTENTVDFDSFIFEDKFTNGYYYRYYVRYYDTASKSYLYSSKSDPIRGNGGVEANLKPTDTTFRYWYEYNRKTEIYTLASLDTLDMPDSTFKELDIVLSNGSATKPFKLSALSETPAGNTTIPIGEITDLHRILPGTFLDVELTVKGIIGIYEQKEATETPRFEYYYWTNLTPAKVKIHEIDVNGDELDDGSTEKDKMTVPSTAEPVNGFDYSLQYTDDLTVTLSTGVELDLSL